jgi:hypothetical protein
VTDGGGNINLLPELVDVNNNDLRLAATSPCIDVGDSNALPADTLDLDGDGDVNEQIPFDMDGNPRIVGQAVDMGAYESQALRIVYVDATDGETGNTALAAGGVFTAVDVGTTGSGVDDFWRIRAFANEGTIFESGGDWASNINTEDYPRLVTMVAVPEDDYNVYVYFWADGDQWRIQAALADVAGDLPMYLANDSEGEAIVAVAEDFEEPVPMLTESNRTLWQVNLGTTGVTNMITVYVDDEPNHLNGSRRTWYDGIGYEVAAEP